MLSFDNTLILILDGTLLNYFSSAELLRKTIKIRLMRILVNFDILVMLYVTTHVHTHAGDSFAKRDLGRRLRRSTHV